MFRWRTLALATFVMTVHTVHPDARNYVSRCATDFIQEEAAEEAEELMRRMRNYRA